jgi:putative oxidoreductase
MNHPRLIIPALGGIYDVTSKYAVPLIRIAAGLFLMPHGAQKLFGMFGGDPTAMVAFFSKMGMEPAAPLVTVVGLIEFFGGLLLAIGLLTRPAAAAIFVMLTVAWYKVHLAAGFFWTDGGLEYPLLWSIIALAFVVRGGGDYSVDRMIGKEF